MFQQSKQNQQKQSKLIQTFLYSIKSKETQKAYLIYMKYFEDYYKHKIDSLLTLQPKAVEQILIDYIISMRDKGLSHSSINGRLAAINSFLLLNDFTLNIRKIKRFIGEDIKTIKDEAYTREDLQRMFQHASFRTKVIISIYSSTGIRKGALLNLRLKHITRIEDKSLNLYKFVIYENTKEEYITFCTPECASMIDAYLDQRRTAGEKITDESYLLRNDFDRRVNGRNVRQSNVNNIARLFDRLLDRIEFREVNHITENYKYQRHKKSQFHAFRKYFNTCLANCDVNVTIKEILMGHSVGLDDSYFRPTEQKLLLEYSKAINELTINEENRLKKKVNELQEKQDRIDRLVNRIDGLEKQLGIGII